MEFSRIQAEQLLDEHVKDDYQKLHAHMVANAMEAYADKFGEDKDLWYITGLLHDLDYFEYPSEHPGKSLDWFKKWDYPDELIHAVAAHGIFEPRIKPQSDLAKALIAVDELCGFLHAYSLMRPGGYEGMKASKAKKKFKDKAFAAKVSREEILYGVEELGVDFSEHVTFLIEVFGRFPL